MFRRSLVSLSNDLNRQFCVSDAVSVNVAHSERRDCGFLDDSTSENSQIDKSIPCSDHGMDYEQGRFGRYTCTSEQPKEALNFLSDKFGADALTSKTKSEAGLLIDESQVTVLKNSWRADNPSRITSFKESYKNSFPIQESCENFFKVPTLDEIVEDILIERYKQEGTFGRTPSLVGKSMKCLEKVAFQGQLAARMGLITSCYTQQALSTLLDILQQK